MTSSFSIPAGFFCVAWSEGGQTMSVWGKSFIKIAKIFFKAGKDSQLWFFPESGDAPRGVRRGR